MKRNPEPNSIGKPMSASQEVFATSLLRNIAATQIKSTDPRQAMMLEHFNSHGSGAATFSHKTLGTKLRRFG
jgi:hypothetical protein